MLRRKPAAFGGRQRDAHPAGNMLGTQAKESGQRAPLGMEERSLLVLELGQSPHRNAGQAGQLG